MQFACTIARGLLLELSWEALDQCNTLFHFELGSKCDQQVVYQLLRVGCGGLLCLHSTSCQITLSRPLFRLVVHICYCHLECPFLLESCCSFLPASGLSNVNLGSVWLRLKSAV